MKSAKPDIENIDEEYWEQILHDHHLGMNRGVRKWLLYGHDYARLTEQPCGGGRRVPPKKNLGQVEKDGLGK